MHEHDAADTALLRWAPATRSKSHTHIGGEEMLVLAGSFRDENGEYPAGTWSRSPSGSRHTPSTGTEGAMICAKVGALTARFMTPGGQ